MKLENLIEALPEFDGVEASTLNSIANEVANAGYMPSSSSAEEHISPTAAANLLIAMNTPYTPESPAVSVPIFRGLKKWNDPNYYGLPHHRAFRNMSMAETFGDAIEALLQDACRIRQWFLEGVSG